MSFGTLANLFRFRVVFFSFSKQMQGLYPRFPCSSVPTRPISRRPVYTELRIPSFSTPLLRTLRRIDGDVCAGDVCAERLPYAPSVCASVLYELNPCRPAAGCVTSDGDSRLAGWWAPRRYLHATLAAVSKRVIAPAGCPPLLAVVRCLCWKRLKAGELPALVMIRRLER
jgi:hypothetical protein